MTAPEAKEPNRFTWLGRIGYYEQPDTGDYWVRARVYSPTNGRWLSRDPMEDDVNCYRYVAVNPLVVVDPGGQSWWTVIGAHLLPLGGVGCVVAVVWPWRGMPGVSNRFRHCMVSCLLTKECGRLWAKLAGGVKEFWDFFWGVWPFRNKEYRYSAFQHTDFVDNAAGRGRIRRPKSAKNCETRCEKAGLTPCSPEGPPGPFFRR